ncbi:MAG: tRNA 2-thiouridine(34) synthase MnmA [Actinobacteria bacterium HGW-Actinobacteria-1]|jgi:tRNA-specific 2-thiouridylase|nr:MAG: tRNA 2-thiouridine(34) synthase MnmA [Actinobacteria bacterium HGW-Actinobacteria-1]
MTDPRIWIGMSGGVDSSLSAALLLEQGYDCVGVTMDLGRGAPDAAVADARAVCDHLGIPHRVVDLAREFSERVVAATAAAYAGGATPNPCVLCNDSVKFGVLLDEAREDGAALGTGHYARIAHTPQGPLLARAADVSKDQTYFLYRLTGERLRHVVFPLGGLTKSRVREMAAERGLSDKHGAESQDACFLGAGGYPELVAATHPEACVPGDIVDTSGKVLGEHNGLCRYTVGQRRGIGIASAEPLYVLRLDAKTGAVVVGPYRALEVESIVVGQVVWSGDVVEEQVDVMVRYNAPAVRARVQMRDEHLHVELMTPLVGVAPGQSLVCYNGDVVLGGGIIEEAS